MNVRMIEAIIFIRDRFALDGGVVGRYKIGKMW